MGKIEIELLGQLDNSRMRKKVYSPNGLSPTLLAGMGMGGNIVPFVLEISRERKMNKINAIGHLGVGGQKGVVYQVDGISPCEPATQYKDSTKILEIKTMGNNWDNMANINVVGTMEEIFESRNRVYGTNGICPSIDSCGGGNRQPKIMEMKKNDVNRMTEDTNKNIPLNPMPDGVCRTIKNQYGKNSTDNFESQGTFGASGVLHIRQATKEGTIPCEVGGVADLNYPESKTRRGRVQGNGQICPTLTTENTPSVLEEWMWKIDGEIYLIRIRKLTPRECWRLMDFKDEDFEKAEQVCSNTQLYKQAGNSIVKKCLVEIFRNLL